MSSRRRCCAAAIVFGFLFFAGTHPARAQGQPVIRLGECAVAYQPVCARSRKRVLVTYANACVARATLARIVSDGECPENCPSIYKPVYARDANGKRRAFMNACTAKTTMRKSFAIHVASFRRPEKFHAGISLRMSRDITHPVSKSPSCTYSRQR